MSDKKQAIENTSSLQEPPLTLRLKPKILLLDLDLQVCGALSAVGLNVKTGSLGKPYKVEMSASFSPLIGESALPNLTEQEVVVVDLDFGKLAPAPLGTPHRPTGEIDLWGKCDVGFLDPRARTAAQVRKYFDRSYASGAVFILFAAERTGIQLQTARLRFRSLEDQKNFPDDVWDLLTDLGDMQITSDEGEEMQIVKSQGAMSKLLAAHLPGSRYECTLVGGTRSKHGWETLATTKFGDAVALQRVRGTSGTVLVFPHLRDKEAFLKDLFSTVLPDIAPHLFPDAAGRQWTLRAEYELPGVLELTARRNELEASFARDLAELDRLLLADRNKNGWIHDLLTETGDPLVSAVKKGLELLGLTRVVDMDVVRDKEGKSRREDLQVLDRKPTLVIDVKGIGNFPSDEDVLQANKHVTLLMREQGRTDIVGISLINHQRYLPPLERENTSPFRNELLEAALETSLGLLTAFDFYRLIRNVQANRWPVESAQDVLYKPGRIEIVPTHYSYLGRITKVWSEKFGLVVDAGEIQRGDRIAIELDVLFLECNADTLMVNGQPVERAVTGDPTGVSWHGNGKLKEGRRVFRVCGEDASRI